MKIAIINSSGNVGKSTITRELYDRLKDEKMIIEVEGQNSSSSSFKNIRSEKYLGNTDFQVFYEYIIDEKNIIFDIGASEIANFVENATEYSILDSFDYFIVPSIADAKIMEDTIKTIKFLQSEDIENKKIKVIFNQVEMSVENDFSALLNFQGLEYEFDTNLFIKKSKTIKNSSMLKTTFCNVYNEDKKHYRNLFIDATDAKQKAKMMKLDLLNQAAKKQIENFDDLFNRALNLNVNSFESFSLAEIEIQNDDTNENDEDL